MPIDVYSLWLDFQSDNNTSQNGFVRPNTDFMRAVNDISIKLWNKYVEEAQRSQSGRDKMFPFLKSKNIPVGSQGTYYGVAKKPTDYGGFASASILVHDDKTYPSSEVDNGRCDGDEDIEVLKDEYLDNVKTARAAMIDNQRWDSFCTHKTKGPTFEKPGITQVNNEFKVAPRKVSVIVINYYVLPKEAVFKYTLTPGNVQTGSGDQVIYDKANSVQLEWPEQMKEEFTKELKSWYIGYTQNWLASNISSQQKQLNP